MVTHRVSSAEALLRFSCGALTWRRSKSSVRFQNRQARSSRWKFQADDGRLRALLVNFVIFPLWLKFLASVFAF